MEKFQTKKKILFVTPRMALGGTERMISLLSFAFEKAGFEVVTVMYGIVVDFPLAGKVISIHARFSKNYFKKIMNIFLRVKRLRKVISQEQPTHTISYLGNIPPILTGYPVITNIQTHYERMGLVDRLGLHTIFFFKNVQRVIVPSRGLQKSLERKTGLKQVMTIPNAVDLVAIQSLVKPNLMVSRKSIVAVGRMVGVKRFDVLIQWFANSSIKDTTDLVFVGDGEDLESLRSLVQSLNLESVRFVGKSTNPYQYMADARCLVLTSQMETFANVIIESFACGTPVVSVDCDFGPREIIRNGIDGFLVGLNDGKSFMDSVQKLVTDDDIYESMSKHALERSREFSADHIVRKWLDLFSQLEK